MSAWVVKVQLTSGCPWRYYSGLILVPRQGGAQRYSTRDEARGVAEYLTRPGSYRWPHYANKVVRLRPRPRPDAPTARVLAEVVAYVPRVDLATCAVHVRLDRGIVAAEESLGSYSYSYARRQAREARIRLAAVEVAAAVALDRRSKT